MPTAHSEQVAERHNSLTFPRSDAARKRTLGLLAVLLLLVTLLSLKAGAIALSWQELFLSCLPQALVNDHVDPTTQAIVLQLRLPRALLSMLAGAGLAVAGATLQGLFRNPLADPGIIGVTSGGAMGAITMIVLGSQLLPPAFFEWAGPWLIPCAAMLGALMITWLVYRLASRQGHVDLVSMLLIGIAINAMGGALIGFLAFLATEQELRSLTFWTLGSLRGADWPLLQAGAVFIIVPMLCLPAFHRSLNALLLGEEEALHLGIPVQREKTILIALAASIVGATTALCGAIGFIALIVPHMVRSVLGPDYRYLIPASALLGAIVLMLADLLARLLLAPAELPIGILTALLGGPVFLSLLLRRQRQDTPSHDPGL